MTQHEWGPEGPPPEAYSRVTNPGRFVPLHGAAVALADRLEATFDVVRAEGRGLDPELERSEVVGPTVKLVPADPAAATIVLAFTSFPSLIVRCGRWLVQSFPVCGCDACNGTAESEEQRLNQMIDEVVNGRFRESIRIPLLGYSRQEWALGAATQEGVALGATTQKGGSRIARSRARELVGQGGHSYSWAPWPRR